MGIFRCLTLSALLFILPCYVIARGSITFSNNEYKNILIAISEFVPEDRRILTRIQDIFTDVSAFLYNVTKERAYLKEITVLIPKSWSAHTEYGKVRSEQVAKSDILVDEPVTARAEPDKPFVFKMTPCGEPGSYIHLTTNYILDNGTAAQYGPYDKMLVHEWAHLRYGVFDEYPWEDSRDHFYVAAGATLEPTKCSEQLGGSIYDPLTNGPRCWGSQFGTWSSTCQFTDDEKAPTPGGKYASLMYRTHLDHVTEFCDDDTSDLNLKHNEDASNLQNRHCDKRSIWQVMRSHADFAGGANPPKSGASTVPTFKFVQSKTKRTVLILDVSGSMIGGRIQTLHQACTLFVNSHVQDGEKIGIVTFNSKAHAVMEMTEMDGNTKSTILAKIPNDAGGGTSIGAGVAEGMAMLDRGEGTAGATCIVVSDGVSSPFVEVIQEADQAGMTCHVLGISNSVDAEMFQLSDITGGEEFQKIENASSTAMNDFFMRIGAIATSVNDSRQVLLSVAIQSSSGMIKKSFQIDEAVGRDTELIVEYDSFSSGIAVVLTSPSGEVYNTSSQTCTDDTTTRITRCTIPGQAESGTWECEITHDPGSSQHLTIIVTSKAVNVTDPPITAEVFWGLSTIDLSKIPPDIQRIYCSVAKGMYPVLNAEVIAMIDTPSGEVFTQPLEDSGSGADLMKDDGIYSAFFLAFVGNNRYNLKALVSETNETVIRTSGTAGATCSAPPASSTNSSHPDIPVDAFQRQASGGSFTVINYSPTFEYPPAKITDVEVVFIDAESRQVALQWTATGSQLDTGTASSYIIRYGVSSQDVRFNDNCTLVDDSMLIDLPGYNGSTTLSNPLPARSEETFVIQFPENVEHGEKVTYFIGVFARDTDGRNVSSNISNIVSVSMTPLPYTPTGTSTELPDKKSFNPIYLVAIAAILLAILVIVVVVYKRHSRRGRVDIAKNNTAQEASQPVKQLGYSVETA